MTPGSLPSGKADIRLGAGDISIRGGAGERLSTDEGVIRFELREGDLTDGRVYLPLPGLGLVDMSFSMHGVALDGTGQVEGHARVDLDDLSFVEVLTPGLDEAYGALSADLVVGGRHGCAPVKRLIAAYRGRLRYSRPGHTDS